MEPRQKAILAVAAIGILLAATPAFAHALQVFTSTYDFQVVDPAEPVVNYSVTNAFTGNDIAIQVNMSSHDGVKVLNGTATISLLLWNDSANEFQIVQTLATDKALTLTPEPTVMNFSFTTDTAGSFRIQVDFTTTGYELA